MPSRYAAWCTLNVPLTLVSKTTPVGATLGLWIAARWTMASDPRGRLHDLAEVLNLPHQVFDAAVAGPGHPVHHSHLVAAAEQLFHHPLTDLA